MWEQRDPQGSLDRHPNLSSTLQVSERLCIKKRLAVREDNLRLSCALHMHARVHWCTVTQTPTHACTCTYTVIVIFVTKCSNIQGWEFCLAVVHVHDQGTRLKASTPKTINISFRYTMQILYVGIVGLDNEWNKMCSHSNTETVRRVSYEDLYMSNATKIEGDKGSFWR